MIIALDVDGTLTRTDGTLSQRTIDALVQVQGRGVELCIASGRPVYGTRHIARALHMDHFGGYLIGFNGGELARILPDRVVADTDEMPVETIYSRPLPEEAVPYALQLGRMPGNTLIAYVGKYIYTENPEHRYVHLSSRRNSMQVRAVRDFILEAPRPLGKCLVAGDPLLIQGLEAEAQARLHGIADAYRSDAFYLEIVSQGIDKSMALRHLLDMRGLSPDQLIAFGDGHNDIGMLRLAGTGIAMGNADPTVQKAADRVGQHTDQDGLAREIEAIFGLKTE